MLDRLGVRALSRVEFGVKVILMGHYIAIGSRGYPRALVLRFGDFLGYTMLLNDQLSCYMHTA